MSKPYYYEQRVVCFIDILAFSKRIKETTEGNSYSKQLLQDTCDALYELNKYKTIIERTSSITGIQITQFSDSIVISFPYSDGHTYLYNIIRAIKYIQVSMLSRHYILMRGGIVIGDLIHTDKILVGPAMISAYEIESKCAFSPRIVLDPTVVKRFNSEKGKLSKKAANKYKLIQKDYDDTSYIDYFDVEEKEILNNEREYLDYYTQMCEMIADNINDTNMAIRMKYLWMRSKIRSSIMFNKPGYKDLFRKIMKESEC